MSERRRLAPFVNNRSREPKTIRLRNGEERKEETVTGTIIYKNVDGNIRIYKEVVDVEGNIKPEYLPYESLDYALAELRKTLRPLNGAVLNFIVGSSNSR
jgi:hypothetical protein